MNFMIRVELSRNILFETSTPSFGRSFQFLKQGASINTEGQRKYVPRRNFHDDKPQAPPETIPDPPPPPPRRQREEFLKINPWKLDFSLFRVVREEFGQGTFVTKKNMYVGADEERRDQVKAAIQHAWAGYAQYSFGLDNLKPVSNKGITWLSLAVTLADSLDSLYLVGLKDEFALARAFVADKMDVTSGRTVFTYDTTRMVLGGLIGAYELSGDEVFKEKALLLGEGLFKAFDTPSGYPSHLVELKTGEKQWKDWTGFSTVLSHFGGSQMEFRQLDRFMDKPLYSPKLDAVLASLYEKKLSDGLFPQFVDPATGAFKSDHVTLGAFGGAFYETLPKVHIQSGQDDSTLAARKLYDGAVQGILLRLMQRSKKSGMLYLGEFDLGSRSPGRKMEQSVCFMPGILALAAEGSPKPKRDLDVATALMETCFKMWQLMPSGLAPEAVEFLDESAEGEIDFKSAADYYALRGETVESLFYLWRVTKNIQYRDWAWEIFQAVQRHCITPSSYTAVSGCSREVPEQTDLLHSVFIAKTLKFLYLIFSGDDTLPLDEWVFSAGGHPYRIVQRRRNDQSQDAGQSSQPNIEDPNTNSPSTAEVKEKPVAVPNEANQTGRRQTSSL